MKRILCFLLSAVVIFSMLAVAAPHASAAATLKTSEKGIQLIKDFEGFHSKTFYDYGQYSIGYGTTCKYNEYPGGITEEKADELLRNYLAKLEPYLDQFAAKYGLKFTQQQYDALISFTYNLGTNWMNNESTLRTAIIGGAKGSDLIFAMTMWCNAGGSILTGLVNRRLAEANLYLNGVYSKDPPSSYKYVLFNNNSDSAVTTVKIQGYDANRTDRIRATPTLSGYRLLGWYTKAEGGEWITSVTSGTPGTLYAHWQKIDGAVGNGVAANYVRYSTKDQLVHKAPQGSKSSVLKQNTKLTIVGDYMDENGTKWGRLSGGGWVDLTKTVEAQQEAQGEAVDMKVTVTANGVNIRKGPGTSYPKNGKANKGQVLQLTHIQPGGNYIWGQFSGGWICLDYTDYDVVSKEDSADSNKVTANGIVVNTDKLNIRSRPSASSSKVGQYSRGDKVQITLQQKVGSTTWGKTDKGWISLYYISLTPVTEDGSAEQMPTEPAPTDPEPTVPAPSEPDKPGTDKNEVIASGAVVDCTTLRIRAGAGTKYDQVGSLKVGEKVEIYEMTVAGKQIWGRMGDGWICMEYVKLDAASSGGEDAGIRKVGTVVNCTNLNVRAGAGTSYAKVDKLAASTQVEILDTTTVGRTVWGRTDKGWVSMDYIKLMAVASGNGGSTNQGNGNQGSTDQGSSDQGDTGPTTAVNKVGVITGTSQLRVRATPGTDGKQVGTLKKGERVVILETAKVGSSTWGRTEKGWIHMFYVKLNSETVPSGAVVRTVTASNLRIRAGAGTKYDHVGNYLRGSEVVILEQTTVGKQIWGRTDKGWICMDYVK